jgi:hypothetical protein
MEGARELSIGWRRLGIRRQHEWASALDDAHKKRVGRARAALGGLRMSAACEEREVSQGNT